MTRRPAAYLTRRLACAMLGCAILLFTLPAMAQPGDIERVWQIGQSDGQSNEFDGHAEGHGNYYKRLGDYDRLFMVGHDDPAKRWTWILPGPLDKWAGCGYWSWRVNFAALAFTLAQPPEQAGTLVVQLAKIHPDRPPTLRVEVNGHRHIVQLNPEHLSVQLPIPAEQLRVGSNIIRFVATQGSWAEFDAVWFEAQAGAIQLAEPRGLAVQGVAFDKHLLATDARPHHPLTVDVINPADQNTELELWVDGQLLGSHAFPPGRQAWGFELEPVATPTPRQVEVRDASGVLFRQALTQQPCRVARPSDWVNQMAGTTNSRWMFAPGPWMPLSLMRIAPDNETQSWKSGYDYMIESVAGFSHIHEWTMSGLLTMPATGDLPLQAGPEHDPDAGWRSRIDPRQQTAEVGYYRVPLQDSGIQVELTATERCAMQRLTYPKAQVSRLICALQTGVDEYGTIIEEAKVWIENDHEIRGWSRQVNRGSGYPERQDYILHFVMQFDQPIASLDTWAEGQATADVKELVYKRTDKSPRGDCGFSPRFAMPDGGVLSVRTGISLVDVDGAVKNLHHEITEPFAWDFDGVVEHHKRVWDELLARFEIKTADDTRRRRLYTCLYRSLAGRCAINDVDGRWRDADEQVQQVASGRRVFSSDAMWGTHWNLSQLWNWFYPEVSADFVATQVDYYNAIGWTLKGPAGGEAIGVMVGSPEIPVMAGAWTAGVRPVEAQDLWEAVYHQLTEPGHGRAGGGFVGNEHYEDYLSLGYLSQESRGHTSSTLEYAYQDWAAAQLARMMDRPDADIAMFTRRGSNWHNAIHPDLKQVAYRNRQGQWSHAARCAEGSPRQFRWFVPHEMDRLIERLGGEAALDELENDFQQSVSRNFMAPGDNMASIPINHGNQPMMHVSWIFNRLGRPASSQRWVREILNRYYGFTPYDAYLGDEDQGQMSGWLVLATCGVFSIDGGIGPDSMVELVPPSFESITIRRARGPDWIIQAPLAVATSGRASAVQVNGQVRPGNRVPLSVLLSGDKPVLIEWLP